MNPNNSKTASIDVVGVSVAEIKGHTWTGRTGCSPKISRAGEGMGVTVSELFPAEQPAVSYFKKGGLKDIAILTCMINGKQWVSIQIGITK